MLTLKQCRKFLGDDAHTEADLELLRAGMYGIARVAVDDFLTRQRPGNGSQKPSAVTQQAIDGKARVQDQPKPSGPGKACGEASGDTWPKGKKVVQSDGTEPWIHVAAQVINGEFHAANRSMRESLIIGLRGIDHPACRRAVTILIRSTT